MEFCHGSYWRVNLESAENGWIKRDGIELETVAMKGTK
jgi:hypothetical protein